MRTSALAWILVLLLAASAWATTYDLSQPSASQVKLGGPEADADLGYSIAVGDLDGDGLPDLAVGAPGFGAESAGSLLGAVYVLLSTNGVVGRDVDLASDAADVKVVGEVDYNLGYSVAIGDVNHDGRNDLIVGAARAPGPSDEAVLGAVFVFFGRADWPAALDTTSDPDLTIWGEKADGQFGARLAVGDFDGDGADDLFVAAPGYEDVGAPSAGKVYGFRGGTLDGVIDLRQASVQGDVEVVGETGGQRLGLGLALGDLDGDGYADLAMGAPGLSPPLPGSKEGNPGVGYVIRGRALTADLLINLASAAPDVRLSWPDQTGNLGAALAVGDIDGDGLLDLAIAAPNLPTKSTAGDVFVVHGQYTLPAMIDLSTADLTIRGAQADERFGFALAAGDVTGDCVDDLLIGAPRFGSLGVSRAYVIAGSRDYPTQHVIDLAGGGAPLHTILGAAARDEAGFAVALADLDGDGVEDMIVGARAENLSSPSRAKAGAAYAVLSASVNQRPVADAGPDREGVADVPIVLDGSGSADPEGAPIEYAWAQTAGPADATIFHGDTATAVVVCPESGQYRFQLIVADCRLASTPDDVVVTIDEFPSDDDIDDDAADDDAADDDATDDDAADDDDQGGGDDGGGIWGSEKKDDVGVYGGGGCSG
jgi:hypothetical protein